MSDDLMLKQDVLAALGWQPCVNAAHIGVTVEAGVVTLSGHVGTFSEKCAAEKATQRVKGVKAIVEQIEVRLLFDLERSDDEIASAAIDHLAWDASLPPNAVKVRIEKGWITLSGEVDSNYQKSAAESDVRGLYGVVRVSNEIEVKPMVNATIVSDDIKDALHRTWFDTNTIAVSADGSKVTLTGIAHSWQDRERAEATAWSALGVASVVNHIAIG